MTISVAIFDRGNIPPEKGTIDKNDVTDWINENAPVNVKFIPVPRWETVQTYNIWLASGETPDIFMEFQPEMTQNYVNQGVLMEVGPLLDQYGADIRALTPPEVAKWSVYNGKEYAVPQIRSKIAVANWMVWIREDIRAELGFKELETTDDFLEFCRAVVSNDVGGMGAGNVRGFNLAGPGSSGRIDNMFGIQGGWVITPEGEFEHCTMTPNMLDVLTFKKTLWDEGLTDKEYLTDSTGANAKEDWLNGKYALYSDGTGGPPGWLANLKTNVPAADPQPLKALKSPYGHQGWYQERECGLLNMIPVTSKNPEAAIKYLNWMITEGWEPIAYGVEGLHYVKEDGVIISTYTQDQWDKDLKYRGDFKILANENIQPEDLKIKFSKAAPEVFEARMLEAKAIATTFLVPYKRDAPISNLGLAIITEQMPDLDAFAVEIFDTAINGGQSAEAAWNTVRDEWNKRGYQNIKAEYNAKAREMGLIN